MSGVMLAGSCGETAAVDLAGVCDEVSPVPVGGLGDESPGGLSPVGLLAGRAETPGWDRAERASPEGLTTAQLLARQTPAAWLLPGMLRQGQAAVILGPSRCLKTSLAVDLCGALASGGKFLGRFAVERAFRVGFVGGEAAQEVAVDLARRWSAAAEVDLATLDQLVWGLNLAEAGDPDGLRRLAEWIARYQLEAVLLDPDDLALLTPRAQARWLADLVRCCLAAGATPIICCETRKEIKPRPLEAADLAAAPCRAIARQWLLVNRREAFEPGSGEHQLWLTLGGGSGQSGQWGVDIDEGETDDPARGKWEATVCDPLVIELQQAELAAELEGVRLRQRLRGVLRQIEPDQATKLKIRQQAGMSGAKFGATWKQLVAEGEIAPAAVGAGPAAREPRYRLVEGAEKKLPSPVHSNMPEEAVEQETGEREPAEPEALAVPTLPRKKSSQSSPLDWEESPFLELTTAELIAMGDEEPPPQPAEPPRRIRKRRPQPKKKKKR